MASNVLYHAGSLAALIFLYIGSRGHSRKGMPASFIVVYISVFSLIAADMAWNIVYLSGVKEPFWGYFTNIIYYQASLSAVFAWYFFTVQTMESRVFGKWWALALVIAPVAFLSVLTYTTPIHKLIFYMDGGKYLHGPWFFMDSATKLGYLLFTCIYALCKVGRDNRKFARRRTVLLAVYCFPVLIGGVFQALFGIDFNCISPVFGLAIVYSFGLSNKAQENAGLITALAKSYMGAFLIDIDDNTIRTIHADGDGKNEFFSEDKDYEAHVAENVRTRVAPEDRVMVERYFAIPYVLRQLENKNSYSLVYRGIDNGGKSSYRKATFMKAFTNDEHHYIFIGFELIDTEQALLQEKESLNEEKERFENVKEAFTSVMANVIEARDVDSGEHVNRVKGYSQMMAMQVMEDCPEYELTQSKVRYITMASALHDIGKIMIPDAILLKPGRLTEEEFDIMKTHSEKGCQILDKLVLGFDEEFLRYAKEICRWHHEKYDGKGYPDGLVGDEIPISAQIVSLVDCFDALTTKRVYKDAYTLEEAYQMIQSGECGAFSPALLNCFTKVYERMLK